MVGLTLVIAGIVQCTKKYRAKRKYNSRKARRNRETLQHHFGTASYFLTSNLDDEAKRRSKIG